MSLTRTLLQPFFHPSRLAASVALSCSTSSFCSSTPPSPSPSRPPPCRFVSSSSRTLAASSSGLAKRDATRYGIPPSNSEGSSRTTAAARRGAPKRSDTDSSQHPLWRFFHDQQSLVAPDKRKDNSSRSWSSFELRRKSFTELHQLWYIFLRERNVLLTQREEARRVRVDLANFSMQAQKLRMVQKSMARTKQVLAERRRAALQAAEILRSRGELERAESMQREAEQLAGVDAE